MYRSCGSRDELSTATVRIQQFLFPRRISLTNPLPENFQKPLKLGRIAILIVLAIVIILVVFVASVCIFKERIRRKYQVGRSGSFPMY